MPTRVMHIDVDAFFASVEQLRDPRLRKRPVAVGNGVVASPSYEARARGVTTAMPIHQALRVCPELIVLDGRHEVYRCFTEAIWEICRRYAPAMETFLDEAFSDFSGTEHVYPDLLELGARIKREIRDEVGLPVTIGIAKNRMISKLAAKTVKPDGLRQIPEGEEEVFLLPLPIGKIAGMGPRTTELFHDMNIRTIAEFRSIPLATLVAMLGKVGASLYERARGQDSRPIHEREVPKQISRETSLEKPTAERGELEGVLFYLIDRAIRAIRKLGLKTRTMRIRIRYSDGEENETSVSFPPTAFDEDLQPLARRLLWKLYTRRVTVRFLGSGFSNFQAGDGQLELFTDESLTRFHTAVDAVRDKFGHGAIVAGRAIELLNRLPHDAHGYVLRTPSLTQ
ncbi:MAG TPA: DNA polymerase IV [Planctomycetota bacterium]|nr:DNA polymerase IV [Planctomycetota bacterium]